ncbi:hypothetical protein V7654_12025 [Bacillus sp. JJ1609]|uniref:hypothetical protein n=1 Tax=Bacillus sp. JJ1609 TaxID=3122977 RepID=UPI002FFE7B7A
MKILANNDELKQQIEGVSQSLDLNKLVNFTESFLQEEQKKEQQHNEESPKSEDTTASPLKGLGDFITEENLASMVGMAKNLVNPSTLSLLSKLNNPIQKQEGNTDTTKLMLTIEQLSGDLKKVHVELDQIKQILGAIRQQNSVLQNELLSLTNRRRR